MQDKVILVTGATDGIGKQTALELARMGARVLIHGRTRARAQAALEDLRQATGSRALEAVAADFASLAQVRALAAEVQARHDRLDVLINNAGVLMRRREVTEDGFEATFAVNHLAHFLLTNLLLETLLRSAPARIVVVSSMVHHGARLDFDDLQMERRFDGYGAYAASKLANILFTYELAERLKAEPQAGSPKPGASRWAAVTANCLHPGVIGTKLAARIGAGGGDVEAGAATSVFLASAPEVEGVTGRYFVRGREAESAPQTHDRALRRRLWETSARLVGLSA